MGGAARSALSARRVLRDGGARLRFGDLFRESTKSAVHATMVLFFNASERPTISKPIKLIHITKTGGTSIETSGRRAGYFWGTKHDSRSPPVYGPVHEPFVKKPARLKTTFDWFMSVRNPFSRIVSEYNMYHGRHTKNRTRFNTYIHGVLPGLLRFESTGPQGWLVRGHYTPQH